MDSSTNANAHAIKQMHIQYLFCQTVSDLFLCFGFFSSLLCFVLFCVRSSVIFVRVLFILTLCHTMRTNSNKWKKTNGGGSEIEKMILCTHIISVMACFFGRPICTSMTQKRPKIKRHLLCFMKAISFCNWERTSTCTDTDTFTRFRRTYVSH